MMPVTWSEWILDGRHIWKRRILKAERLHSFFFTAGRTNLTKSMKSLEKTKMTWLKVLHEIFKFTRSESNLIEEMGSQDPKHVQLRWVSLENNLKLVQNTRWPT